MDERENGPEAQPAAAQDGQPRADGANGAVAGEGNGLSGVGVEDETVPSAADVAELERLQGELNSINDRYLRLAAEFDNYRKRIERERTEQHARSQADLARRLLDVLDDLQRVEHFDPNGVSTQSLLEALELVEKKFRTVL